MRAGLYYVVKTDLPPEGVTRIAMEIFARWVDFALGRTVLNGKRIVYPSGRYAGSISVRSLGPSSVAVIADEDMAPEAAILEQGHGTVDLKMRLSPGTYPMHRAVGGNRTPGSLRRVGSGPPGRTPRMWAEVRAREFSGFASIGPNSSPDSWIIPPMAAYSPGLILAAQAQAEAGGRR